MEFSFSKSQELLRKSAVDFLRKECKDLAREAEETTQGYSSEKWENIADLGWLGVGISEEYGGIEGNRIDFIILLEEMGKELFPGPYIPVMGCSELIFEFGTVEQKKKLLPKITKGELIIVPAFIEPAPYVGKCSVENNLDKKKGNYILSGTKLFVPYANTADYFIYKRDNLLLLVDASSSGITCLIQKTIFSDKQCELVLENVIVPETNILSKGNNTPEILTRIQEIGSLSHSAYILGLLEKTLEMTVNYAKERKQFGQPIGAFQIIQHQCADMLIDIEQIKNLTYYAAWKLSEGIPASKEISMAKARASDASRRVSLLGVKIHGGIGIIDEYDMQLYFRKAKAMELAFGDGDFHRDVVAQQLGL